MASSQPTKQNKPLSKSEALNFIPFHNEIGVWEKLESGEVLVEYPLPIKPFFRSILQRFSKKPIPNPTKKLQLDEMGSKVWCMVDGSKNTKEIIAQFAKEYRITNQEAEISVTAFLKELGKRGLIGMEKK